MNYDEAIKLHPKEVEEAIKDFRSSKSKYRKIDAQDLNFGYGFNDIALIVSTSFIDILYGTLKNKKHKYQDVDNVSAFIYCTPRYAKSASEGRANIKVIPFDLFRRFFPENSKKEYKIYLKYRNFE